MTKRVERERMPVRKFIPMPRLGLYELVSEQVDDPSQSDPDNGLRIVAKLTAILDTVKKEEALFAYQVDTWTPERLQVEIDTANANSSFRIEERVILFDFNGTTLTAKTLFLWGSPEERQTYESYRNALLDERDLPLLQ